MISGITLSNLRHSEFSQFISDALSLVLQNDPTALNVQAEYDTLKASHDQLVILLNPELGNSLTEQLELQDQQRDQAITGIAALIKAYTYYFDPVLKAQATKLSFAVDKFGSGIARQSYQSETATIKSLISDLKSDAELTAAYTALQLGTWIDELEQANNSFSSLYLQRVTDISNNPLESVKEKRLAMSTEYYALRDMLTAYHTIHKGAAPFSTTVNQLNELINQYNTLLANRHSSTDSHSSTGSE